MEPSCLLFCVCVCVCVRARARGLYYLHHLHLNAHCLRGTQGHPSNRSNSRRSDARHVHGCLCSGSPKVCNLGLWEWRMVKKSERVHFLALLALGFLLRMRG